MGGPARVAMMSSMRLAELFSELLLLAATGVEGPAGADEDPEKKSSPPKPKESLLLMGSSAAGGGGGGGAAGVAHKTSEDEPWSKMSKMSASFTVSGTRGTGGAEREFPLVV